MVNSKSGKLSARPVNCELIVIEEIAFKQMTRYPKSQNRFVNIDDLETSRYFGVFIKSTKPAKYYDLGMSTSHLIVPI